LALHHKALARELTKLYSHRGGHWFDPLSSQVIHTDRGLLGEELCDRGGDLLGVGLQGEVTGVDETDVLAVNPHRVGKPLFGPLAGVTAPGAAPTESSTGSTRTAASFTSSTLTTARRFTTARNQHHRHSVTASLIMPNTCPNRPEHDRVHAYLPRSDTPTRVAGRLDS